MKLSSRFLGRGLEVFFCLLMVVFVVSAFINTFCPDLLMGEKVLKTLEDAYGFNIKKLSLFLRGVLIVFTTINTAIIVYGLWIGRKIAQLVARGEVISIPSAELFIQLKKTVICMGAFNVIQGFVTYAFLMPKMDLKMMIWSLSMMSIGYLMIFIFFASISAVVTRSARLKAEQDLTV